MSFQRYDNGDNNSFPATHYGTAVVGEAREYGHTQGRDVQDVHKLEYHLTYEDAVAATEYENGMLMVIPEGAVIMNVAVYPITTFGGATTNTITLGLAQKSNGTVIDADGIYTGTPTAGTAVSADAVAGAAYTVTADAFVTVTQSDATAGEAVFVITFLEGLSHTA